MIVSHDANIHRECETTDTLQTPSLAAKSRAVTINALLARPGMLCLYRASVTRGVCPKAYEEISERDAKYCGDES